MRDFVIVSEAHSSQFSGETSVREALRQVDDVLLRNMNVQEAVTAFDRAEAEGRWRSSTRTHRVG